MIQYKFIIKWCPLKWVKNCLIMQSIKMQSNKINLQQNIAFLLSSKMLHNRTESIILRITFWYTIVIYFCHNFFKLKRTFILTGCQNVFLLFQCEFDGSFLKWIAVKLLNWLSEQLLDEVHLFKSLSPQILRHRGWNHCERHEFEFVNQTKHTIPSQRNTEHADL